MAAERLPAKLEASTILLIQQARDRDLLFVHAVRDAATLAGEQVQDVRIKLLDNPPPAESNSFLLDVLISLALGPAAGTLIRAVSTKAIGFAVAKRQLSNALDTDGLNAALGLIESKNLADRFLQRNDDVRNLWTGYTEQTLEIVMSQSQARLLRAGPGPNEFEGDTASVAIRRAAYAHARAHELAAVRAYDGLVAALRSGDVSPDAANQLSELIKKNIDRNYDDQAFEKRLSLLFEASIWAIHLKDAVQVPKGQWNHLVVPGKYAKLMTYLVRRFPHDQGNGYESFASHVGRWPHFPAPATPLAGQLGMGSYSASEHAQVDLLTWLEKLKSSNNAAEKAFQGIGYKNLGPIKPK